MNEPTPRPLEVPDELVQRAFGQLMLDLLTWQARAIKAEQAMAALRPPQD